MNSFTSLKLPAINTTHTQWENGVDLIENPDAKFTRSCQENKPLFPSITLSDTIINISAKDRQIPRG
jgi:hypothetical protein